MKKISPVFPVISIVLSIAGFIGAAITFWLSIVNFKNREASNVMSGIILLLGLIWAVLSIIAGVSAFSQTQKIIALQRNVSQNKLDPRYSKTAKKAYRARIDFKQCRIRSAFIILVCAAEMIFSCVVGVKTGQVLTLTLCGIVLPFIFLFSAKSNS